MREGGLSQSSYTGRSDKGPENTRVGIKERFEVLRFRSSNITRYFVTYSFVGRHEIRRIKLLCSTE